jgi:Cd2+/Zn2+-exporting ATPase
MIERGSLVLPVRESDDPEGCLPCAERIARQLRALPGVMSVTVEAAPARLRYEYDPETVNQVEVEQIALRASSSLGERYVHHVLAVEGMACADCARTVERGVRRLPGVEYANVNLAAARLSVEYDASAVELPTISRRVRELGYTVAEPRLGPVAERLEIRRLIGRRDNLLALIAGLLTLAGTVGALLSAPHWLSTALYAIAIAVGGGPLALKGARAVRATRALDINLLMTVAVLGAAAIGDWFEAATVVFLFSLGEALEGYAMDRVRRSVRALLSLAPPTALVKRRDGDVEVPVTEVRPGELVVVRAGQRIPLDGIVVAGVTTVDQSAVTGESLPAAKSPGSAVFAGTMNGEAPVTLRVTRLAGDSTVAKIIQLVEQAQAQRAPVQLLVDRFARYYTPVVIAGAVAVALVPPLVGGGWLDWIGRALVLLVIACPCALVLSTPVSIVSALSAAARHGILIKGGAALERAAEVDTIAIDKTGTLTAGRPELTGVIPLDGRDERELLALGATLERHSEHPLGRALLRASAARGVAPGNPAGERVIPGAGLVATLDATEYRIGSLRIFEPAALTPEIEALSRRIEESGGSAVFVGARDRVLGVFAFADTARQGAQAALHDLRAAGVRSIVMLSGDRPAAANAVASGLALDRVAAGLLPHEKVAAVRALRKDGHVVAMVGDGVNDAPALAAADLGIAMGVAGSDAAIETADIALMSDDLRGVANAIRLGGRTRRTIAANIALSIGIKALVLSLAVAGQATLWMAIAADVGVSLLVIANGMRLLRWSPASGTRSLSS